MPQREEPAGENRPVVYCLVPRALAGKLHDSLRRHFRDDSSVEVIVERRGRERRSGVDRRAREADWTGEERRGIRGPGGRRAGERRAPVVKAKPPALPRKLRPYAERLSFFEILEPSSEQLEERDSALLVVRFQAGEKEVFERLYLRYFDRVYSYLRVLLRSEHDAEDAAQQVFLKVFNALPRYEPRGRGFSYWMFTIVKNHARSELGRRSRTEVVDTSQIREQRDLSAADEDAPELPSIHWLSNRELLLFVERLPQPQRQVLVMRYMLDMTTAEIAQSLDRSQVDVRTLQHRALTYLRQRLGAVGRGPSERGRIRMRAPLKPARVLRRRRFVLRA